MEIGLPLVPASMVSSIVDDTYTNFDNTLGVAKGQQRLYGGEKIYEARTNIYPLATYQSNDYSVPADTIVTRLSDKVEVTNTAVPCTQNVTTIYIEDSSDDNIVGKYYTYTGATGNVDFTNLIVLISTVFTESSNLRHIDVIPPDEDSTSIYWEYINVLNSLRHLDGTLWNKTELDSGTTITNTYEFTETVNAVAFFDINCTSIEITGRLISTDEIVVPTITINLVDLYGINDSYSWHYTPVSLYLKNAFSRLPIYANIKYEVSYINSGTPPKVGETVFSYTQNVGTTLNNPTGRKRKFDKITIDSDGKKTRVKSNTMVDEVSYTISVEKQVIDNRISLWATLINENLLVVGDETGTYSNLINYGSISELPYEIDSAKEQNKYIVKINTLI